MSKIAPCKGCVKRSAKCHSVCCEYIEWRKEMDAEAKLRRQESEAREYVKAVVIKANKHRGTKWRGGNIED